jgi:hypothetical protein
MIKASQESGPRTALSVDQLQIPRSASKGYERREERQFEKLASLGIEQ